MRANEFISEAEKLDEVLPLITGAARLAGGVAKGVSAVAKGASAVAKTVNKGVGAVAKTVNTGPNNNIGQPMGKPDPVEPKDPKQKLAVNRAKDQMIRPGSSVNLATSGPGGVQPFKITSMSGDNVEIENPKPAAGEPKKVVYNKNDIKKSMTI